MPVGKQFFYNKRKSSETVGLLSGLGKTLLIGESNRITVEVPITMPLSSVRKSPSKTLVVYTYSYVGSGFFYIQQSQNYTTT